MSIKRFHRPQCEGGTCQCPWRLDFRPLGMSGPHQRFQFPTRKAAEHFEAENRIKAKRGEYRAPEKIPTFAAAAQSWLADKANMHPATLSGWRSILKHLKPLDPLRLDQITVARIEQLRDELLKHLGAKRVRDCLTIASAIFKAAQRRSFVSNNPAALAQRPRTPVREVTDAKEETGVLRPDEVLSSDEIRRLLDAATPGLWKTYLATAAASGLRSEELGGLQWADIEIDAGRLFVRRSLSWTRDEGQVGLVKPRYYPPKTRSGARTIPLPAELVPMLRAWKLECPPSKPGLVFCNEAGEPLRRSRILNTGVYPACRRAGLRRCSVKSLRHSYASGLLARGCALTQVAHLMGHSSPMITLRVYSHWMPSEDRGEARAYGAAFLCDAGQRRAAQV
jgi:integrase